MPGGATSMTAAPNVHHFAAGSRVGPYGERIGCSWCQAGGGVCRIRRLGGVPIGREGPSRGGAVDRPGPVRSVRYPPGRRLGPRRGHRRKLMCHRRPGRSSLSQAGSARVGGGCWLGCCCLPWSGLRAAGGGTARLAARRRRSSRRRPLRSSGDGWRMMRRCSTTGRRCTRGRSGIEGWSRSAMTYLGRRC